MENEKFKIKERDMLKKIPIITLSVQQCEQNHIRKVISKNKLDNLSEKENYILEIWTGCSYDKSCPTFGGLSIPEFYWKLVKCGSQYEAFKIPNSIPEFEDFSYPPPLVDHKIARERCLNTYKMVLSNPQ